MDRIDTSPTPQTGVVTAPDRFTARNRVGFVLALLLGVADTTAMLGPAPPEGTPGPPLVVLVVSTLCGVLTLAGVGYGWWRRSRPAIRVAAGSRVLSMLLSVPVFFVDGMPPALRALAAVSVVLTIVCVALVLAPPRRTAEAVR